MTCNCARIQCRISATERGNDLREANVLRVAVRQVVFTFKLDADGEIVAASAAAKEGIARVPRAPLEGDELDQSTVTPDEEVRRDFQAPDAIEVGMEAAIETIGEKMLYVRPAVFAGRQTDAVDDDHFRLDPPWPVVLIRRRALTRRPDEADTRADGVFYGFGFWQLLFLRRNVLSRRAL